MNNEFGAHELMEAHEVLTNTMDGINTFSLYRQHVTDQQLAQIIDRQVNFMEKEYNDMVSYLSNHRGVTPDVYHSRSNTSIKYGLRNPSPSAPHEQSRRLTDRDVASAMLGQLKCGSTAKMRVALECADAQLRHIVMQGAVSCAEQAYEVFTFMNQKGMYQVPTMQHRTQNTVTNMYQQTGTTPGTTQGAYTGTAAGLTGNEQYNPGFQGQMRQ